MKQIWYNGNNILVCEFELVGMGLVGSLYHSMYICLICFLKVLLLSFNLRGKEKGRGLRRTEGALKGLRNNGRGSGPHSSTSV